jgi:transposase
MGRSTTVIVPVTYAGIDYHKRFSVVTLGDANGTVIEQKKLYNDRQLMTDYFKSYVGISVVIESCRGFEWLADLLTELGLHVVIGNAQQIKLIAKSKFKNDKIDSKILMELLAKDYLPICYRATRQEREMRERIRWRIQLMRASTRTKLAIIALIDKENLGIQCKDPFTKTGRQWLRSLELSPSRRLLLSKELAFLEHVEEVLAVEDKWIRDFGKSNEQVRLLQTIPGFGQLIPVVYLVELGDPARFKRASQVSSYFGLVPSLDESADKRVLGRITKAGNSDVRWLLVQAAWRAVATCPQISAKFHRIASNSGKNPAIVAIARTLAETAFCVLRNQKPFDPQRVATGIARARR